MAAVRDAAASLGYRPFLIAKIERSRALEQIDHILKETDGMMIARGDLGVEIPNEEIAVVQKQLMRKANMLGKPVITATQMLESMTDHRRPTRAEATDVANAILDGQTVMLSEESATESILSNRLPCLQALPEPSSPTGLAMRERYVAVNGRWQRRQCRRRYRSVSRMSCRAWILRQSLCQAEAVQRSDVWHD
jgi:hypothetical protein